MSKIDELLKDLQHNTINFTIKLLSDKNKEVVFRPIKTKDQKILAIARDETKGVENADLENFKALIKLLDMLLIKCPIAFNDMELPDFLWLLLNIRAKSLGEKIDLIAKCHSCGKEVAFTLDVLSDYEKIERKEVFPDIKLTDNLIVTLGRETVQDLYDTLTCKPSERDLASAATMLKKIEYNEEVLDLTIAEKMKIIEELSNDVLSKIKKYVDEAQYGISLSKPYKCPKCDNEGKFKFDTMQIINFF